MIFKNYNKCIYCNSKKIKKIKKQFFKDNFYLESIRSDLGLSINKLQTLKTYKCTNCKILQNNPWFTENISRKIYSNIYGQHNRSWSNIINFAKTGKTANHGHLFEKIIRKIKIKNYAEFNSPFTGLMLDFFQSEYKKSKFFYKNVFSNTLKYLSSRQVAGENDSKKKNSIKIAKKYFNKINRLKKNNIIKKKVNKYLFLDNSSLCWGQNDNYKSVSSRSLASELIDIEIKNFDNTQNLIKFDLFGIFHTLDHTFEPKKIMNFALKNSKYVVVYCHVDERVEKQHLFSITKDFLNYLNTKKIYTIDLTKVINKKFNTPELYFLCSKKINLTNRIKF